MKTYTKEELKEILEKHKKWLNGEEGGKRADLSYADLSDAVLSGAVLSHADLRYAVLNRAVLSGAVLSDAVLSDAVLSGADLSDAVLSGAVLSHADLRYAVLNRADLSGAVLSDAVLSDAVLSGAVLSHADLRYAKAIDNVLIAYTNQCPQEGSFIAFKKASGRIVKLLIPEDAKRSNATSNKCRCDKAKVLGIYDFKHNLLKETKVASNRDKRFIYKVGETVEVKDFDDNRWNECSTGIHFFLTFEMAVLYS